MRKFFCIISIALLTLTSCISNDDNPATPDLNLSEKIIGKWIRIFFFVIIFINYVKIIYEL